MLALTKRLIPFQKHRFLGVFLSALLVATATGAPFYTQTSALQLQNREIKLSAVQPSSSATYAVKFDTLAASTIGSIRIRICTNSPLYDDPCTAPTGFDFASASVASQSGITGFSISPLSTANELILTRPAAAAAAVSASYDIQNVTNPDTAGTYYGRLETYASTDATGALGDYGGTAFQILGGLSVQTTVPPYLLFCTGKTIQPYDCGTATGSYIDFGDFSSNTTSSGTTQMLVGTNAEFGYTVRLTGTTLTSGINTINPLASPDISRRGQSQFGLNLRTNATPPVGSEVVGPGTATVSAGYDQQNLYKFNPGDVIASSVSTDAYRLFTISYMVNVAANQAPGYYVTTIVYVALASF